MVRNILFTVVLFVVFYKNLTAQETPIYTCTGLSSSIESVAFSPDNQYVFTGGGYFFEKTSELMLWDAFKGTPIRTFRGHADFITCVAYSSDGKYAASASADNTVKIWDMQSFMLVRTFADHKAGVNCVAFSPDGSFLATGSVDKTVKVLSLTDSELTRTSTGHTGAVTSIAWSHDGKYIVSGGADNSVRLWDAMTGNLVRNYNGHTGQVSSVAYSPDGKYIASGGYDKTIRIWDATQMQMINSFKGHSNWVSSVAFNNASSYLLSGGFDKLVILWDFKKGTMIRTFAGHKAEIKSVCFSPDGKYFVSAGRDKSFKMWNINSFAPYKTKVKEYVEQNMIEWQKKGKYEKLADYQLRVSESARNERIFKLMNEGINKFGLPNFVQEWSSSTLDYDSESEVFKITFPSIPAIYVPVPIADAPEFEKNIKNYKFDNAIQLGLQDDKFIVTDVSISEPYGSKFYAYNINTPVSFNSVVIDYKFKPIEIVIPNQANQANNQTFDNNQNQVIARSDVDINIPKTGIQKATAYALVIGNEDYSTFQTGLSKEVNVPFAVNDATVFADYLINTIGIPERQIKVLSNATAGQIKQALGWLTNLAQIEGEDAEIYFYFSGHGLPDQNTREPYIIPVDVSGTDLQYAIPLTEIYNALTKYPAKRVSVFMDACFSGGARNQSLVVQKSVKIKPKDSYLTGNFVVFSSSSGEETSNVWKEKQHGYFTYSLLKKIQESKGDVNYFDLGEYVIKSVKKESGLNNLKQNPQVMSSPGVGEDWKTWNLLK